MAVTTQNLMDAFNKALRQLARSGPRLVAQGSRWMVILPSDGRGSPNGTIAVACHDDAGQGAFLEFQTWLRAQGHTYKPGAIRNSIVITPRRR